MRRAVAVRHLALAALALTGAAACVAEPDPRPGPIRAMEPRPNPTRVAAAAAPAAAAVSTQERVRRNRWLTRFWEELTPAQQRRVEERMRRARPPLAADRPEAQRLWDTMGLNQRDALVFGTPGARSVQPAPATAQEASPSRAGGG